MKIIVTKNILLNAINIVQKAIPSKTTMPILEGILLRTEENFLNLTGNNLEISIEYKAIANVIEQGDIVLNSRTFGEIIRKLPNSDVTIQQIDDNRVTIKCENSLFKINCMSPKTYPELPKVEAINGHSISQKELREMIKQTIFAVSMDDKNKILTGSLFEYKDNMFSLISIDGFRMAVRRHKTIDPQDEFSTIIPGKTLGELAKILENTDAIIEVKTSKNQIIFQTENFKIMSKLIEGQYLNHKNYLPKESGTKVIIKTNDLLLSIERASIIASEEKKYPIKISIQENAMIISSNTEMGTVREELFPEISGDDIEISFNPRYYIEALRNIDDEEVILQYTTNIGPSTIKSIEDERFAYMILPVRT